MVLNGMTPSQIAGIDIELGRNRSKSAQTKPQLPEYDKKEVILKHQKLH